MTVDPQTRAAEVIWDVHPQGDLTRAHAQRIAAALAAAGLLTDGECLRQAHAALDAVAAERDAARDALAEAERERDRYKVERDAHMSGCTAWEWAQRAERAEAEAALLRQSATKDVDPIVFRAALDGGEQ